MKLMQKILVWAVVAVALAEAVVVASQFKTWQLGNEVEKQAVNQYLKK
ncbi:MAG: hypothetical protein BWY74_00815 [Firmicutes bacterium ADurb.Bin419]|nr:MAG: hypothetical protein BWY74_00815 [Firmicutes bacterium ADurb.Bin419]